MEFPKKHVWPRATQSERKSFVDLASSYSLRYDAVGLPIPVSLRPKGVRDGTVVDPIGGGRFAADTDWSVGLYGITVEQVATMFGMDVAEFRGA